MAEFEFQGMLYRTEAEMDAAVAREWLTAGGSNSPAVVAAANPGAEAAECSRAWDVDTDEEAFAEVVHRYGPGRTLYLVSDGTVTAADADTKWNGCESSLVFAANEDEAVRLADGYARGECQPDNLQIAGRTVVCLSRENHPTLRIA